MNPIREQWPNPTSPKAIIDCGCGHTFASQATIEVCKGIEVLLARDPCPHCAAWEWPLKQLQELRRLQRAV